MQDILLLGIDGGATKISGWIVDIKGKGFSLTNINIQKKYSEYSSYNGTFQPVDIKTQLAEMNTGINLTDEEISQGLAYMHAASDVIIELSKNNPDRKLLIGFGMPGLKTVDKRGISALANGPRMPKFVEFIEGKLRNAKIDFYPISHLGSDADYCGIGEEYDISGSFKGVENAYYLGGGTGVADAMKLNGKLITFDNMKTWIAKAWEMKGASDLSFERYASAGGIQYIYSIKSGVPIEQLNEQGIYPPQILHRAIANESSALETINEVSKNLSILIFERILTLYSGYSGLFEFINAAKPKLKKNHSFRGTLLDKIVIGQRLGDLLKESQSTTLLWKDILVNLKTLIEDTNNEKLIEHYLKNEAFNENILTISGLREAPAIGAAVDAFLNNKNNL